MEQREGFVSLEQRAAHRLREQTKVLKNYDDEKIVEVVIPVPVEWGTQQYPSWDVTDIPQDTYPVRVGDLRSTLADLIGLVESGKCAPRLLDQVAHNGYFSFE